MYIDLRKIPKDVIGIEILDDKLLYYYNNRGKALSSVVKGELSDEKPKRVSIYKSSEESYKPYSVYYTQAECNKRGIKDPYQYKKYLESHGKSIPTWLNF